MGTWKELYKEANAHNCQKNISPFINAGYISCVIESNSQKLYYGSNITTNTKLNMCSEKSAIASMINNQEYKITKMVIVNELGELMLPCPTCYEYLLDFCDDDFEILINVKNEKTIKIHDLIPDYWGTFRYNEKD